MIAKWVGILTSVALIRVPQLAREMGANQLVLKWSVSGVTFRICVSKYRGTISLIVIFVGVW